MHSVNHLLAVDAFLEGVRRGPRALVIGGYPGIGKTTLASTVMAKADDAGIAVAAVHVGRPETSLSFAALGDLLETVPDQVFDELSAPLRDALAITMLRTPGAEVMQDPRAVSLATLAVVRQLAAERPLLVAIDDLQWLDVSSARVFSFLLQRLDREPFGLLATRRTGGSGTVPLNVEHDLSAARTDHVLLGPMPRTEFVRLLHERVTPDLPLALTADPHGRGGQPILRSRARARGGPAGSPRPGRPAAAARGRLRRGTAEIVVAGADNPIGADDGCTHVAPNDRCAGQGSAGNRCGGSACRGGEPGARHPRAWSSHLPARDLRLGSHCRLPGSGAPSGPPRAGRRL